MISDELKQEWLEKVSIGKREDNPYTVNTPLRTAPQEIQLDRDVVERALLSGEEYFFNINNSFKKDKEFVLSIIEKGYKREIYDYLPYDMEADIDIFRQCMLRKEKFNQYKPLHKSLVENKELILELLPHRNIFNGLKGAYDQDKDVLAIYMIHHFPSFFERLPKRMANHFQKDKPFLIELIKVYPDAYKKVHKKLTIDLEIIDSLLNKNPKCVAWLPEELRDDKGFMMYAIQKYGCTLTDAQSRHSNDLDLLKASIEKNGKDLFNSKEWATSVELLEVAMQTDPNLNKIDQSVWNNSDLIIKYLNKEQELIAEKPSYNKTHSYYDIPRNLSYFLNTMLDTMKSENKPLYREYVTNKEIMKIVIKHDIEKINLFPGWKNDLELADMAFEISNSVEHIHESKLYDREFMLQEITAKPNLVKNLAEYTDFYFNDFDFLNKFLKEEPNLIAHSPIGKADKNIINRLLIETKFTDINLIDPSLFSDKELVLNFLEKSCKNYIYLPLSLKQDNDVIDKMLTHNIPGAKILIKDSGLSNDLNFYQNLIKKNYVFYDAIEEKSPFKSNRKVIESYLNSLSEFESRTERNIETRFPLSVLFKYGIENGSAAQLKPGFLKYDLENNLVSKEEIKSPKKLKL